VVVVVVVVVVSRSSSSSSSSSSSRRRTITAIHPWHIGAEVHFTSMEMPCDRCFLLNSAFVREPAEGGWDSAGVCSTP
jgi:hypothetical protein